MRYKSLIPGLTFLLFFGRLFDLNTRYIPRFGTKIEYKSFHFARIRAMDQGCEPNILKNRLFSIRGKGGWSLI